MPKGNLLFGHANDIYMADHDGANQRKLASAPDIPSSFSISPDGQRMRYLAGSLTNFTSELWEAHADGTAAHPLLPGWNSPPSECCGRWTSDGKYYIFQSTHEGASNIWALSDEHSWWSKVSREPVQLTTGPLQFSNPLPSKDGKKLFVVGIQPRAELVRYDSKSGDFVPYLGGISAGDVDFSRDGQWVTYVSYPENTLSRSKPDGSARLQLTYPPMRAALAHWSPDGQQIAFSGALPGKPWKLYLIQKDGGSPQPLTSDNVQETDATWSHDGGTVAFGHYDLVHPDQSFIELFDVKTRQLSQLPGSQKSFGPRWSPDGRYIIAITVGGNDKLMLYDFKTKKWRGLNIPLDSFGYLAWSADSAYVYFDTILSVKTGYFRVRISDSKLEKLVDLNTIRRFPDQFSASSWTGLGPGEALVLPRDISTQEIYGFDLHLP